MPAALEFSDAALLVNVAGVETIRLFKTTCLILLSDVGELG